MSTKGGRVRLYLADIRPLYQEGLRARAWALVDAERRNKADASQTVRGKSASLAVGILADYALHQNGLEGCCVLYDETGKPHVAEKGSRTVPPPDKALAFLSLSHSGDYAVCALADRPVGVDIQKMKPVREGVLRHFLEEEERQDFLKRCGLTEGAVWLSEGAAKEFFRLWTAKESYMKLTGSGMAAGFANLAADPAAGTVREKKKAHSAALWKQYRAPEGYFLSVCLKGQECAGCGAHERESQGHRDAQYFGGGQGRH